MNLVVLSGRLVKDPQLRTLPSGNSVVQYTVAVDRNYKEKDGTRGADYIDCTTFGAKAEFAARNFRKGQRVAVTGEWHVDRVRKPDGSWQYYQKCVLSNQEFAGGKIPARDNSEMPDFSTRTESVPFTAAEPMPKVDSAESFMSIPDDLDDEIPFA